VTACPFVRHVWEPLPLAPLILSTLRSSLNSWSPSVSAATSSLTTRPTSVTQLKVSERDPQQPSAVSGAANMHVFGSSTPLRGALPDAGVRMARWGLASLDPGVLVGAADATSRHPHGPR